MGQLSMDLYLKHLRIRYQRANKKLKSQLLETFCTEHGYHKKAAIRLLNKMPIPEFKHKKGGKPPTYDKSKLLPPLKKIWLASDQMCSKRLKKAIPLWLPYYENHYQKLSDEIMHDLEVISASTIDRMLKPIRVKYNKGLSGTKPGSLLKNQIPIKTNQWNTKEVGYVEADTVAHCGDSLKGEFVWSLTLTDIESNVKTLINQRCKGQQHMKWTREGANALLQIRAAIASNDWNLYGNEYVLNATTQLT